MTGYKIDGDKATAQNGAETIDFIRIDGRWYIEPPARRPGHRPDVTRQESRQAAAAPRATAAGKEPEIVVGGVQIAKVVVPDNDFSAKPFQCGQRHHARAVGEDAGGAGADRDRRRRVRCCRASATTRARTSAASSAAFRRSSRTAGRDHRDQEHRFRRAQRHGAPRRRIGGDDRRDRNAQDARRQRAARERCEVHVRKDPDRRRRRADRRTTRRRSASSCRGRR